MSYKLVLQINHISIIHEGKTSGALQLYPSLKKYETVSNLLGYTLCNEIEKHNYFLWFKDLYNQGEVIVIPTITSVYNAWFIAHLRAANPIEKFDFKYHTELSDLLEDGSMGLLFELGKKSNE